MEHGLYDYDLDGDAGLVEAWHETDEGWYTSDARAEAASKGEDPARGKVGDWFRNQSLSGVIGLGLLAGWLLSIPFLLLLPSPAPKPPPLVGAPIVRVVATRPMDGPASSPGPRPFVGPPLLRPIVAVPPPLKVVAVPPPLKVAAVTPLPLPVAARRVQVSPAKKLRDGDEKPVTAVEKPPPAIGMGAVVEGIRRTTESTNWQFSGAADPGLMRSVQVILRELRRATGDPTLGPPVWFGDVPPGLGTNPEGVLHVAMSPAMFDRSVLYPKPVVLDAGRAFRSILIADGDIVLTSAEDCLILATGAVEVSYPTRSVIIAGRLIQASHDTASVLIAGSRLSVSHSYRPTVPPIRPAIYSAPELVSVGHAAGAIFLNSGYLSVSHQSSCRPLDWPALDFDDVNRRTRPFAWEARIEPVPGSWNYQGGGFRLREKGAGRTIHVAIGRPILDPDDRPVPELEGWLAYRATSEYAMLYKGRRVMELPLDSRAIAGRRGR